MIETPTQMHYYKQLHMANGLKKQLSDSGDD